MKAKEFVLLRYKHLLRIYYVLFFKGDRLCGLVGRIPGYRLKVSGLNSRFSEKM
jgi:hypothetical protein